MFKAFLFISAACAVAFGQSSRAPSSQAPLVVQGPVDLRPAAFFTFETKDNKIYLEQPENRFISAWHDIPMFFDKAGKVYNMVVENTRSSDDGYEMDLSAPMNPIVKKDKSLGEVDYIHNLGVLPQTFMNATIIDDLSGFHGNNKPLSVVEISDKMHERGSVVNVKLLGLLALIDEKDQIDYKLMAIDTASTFANEINNFEDMEHVFPDLLAATRGFFRYYRYPIISRLAFDGQTKDAMVAEQIAEKAHQQWMDLIKLAEMPKGFNTESHVEDAAHRANDEEWTKLVRP